MAVGIVLKNIMNIMLWAMLPGMDLGFMAKKNSCGYRFNENFICAAHRTLPLPSIVRVTNIKNGKSIKVLVVDRGPFVETDKRIIDLSKAAARKLGTHAKGLGYVLRKHRYQKKALCLPSM